MEWRLIVKQFFSLVVLLCLFVTPLKAEQITADNIAGIYVGFLDMETFFVVELRVFEDGTYLARGANVDTTMPKPGCNGEYTFKYKKFKGSLDCSYMDQSSNMKLTIDFKKATMEDLQSEEGAIVRVRVSRFGPFGFNFRLHKTDEPYFND